MNLLRLSLAAAPLALLAACTVNPRPVVVNTPPAVVAPAVATVPAPGTVIQAPAPSSPVVMGAPGQAIEIPAGAYPPAGQCRIWVPGLSLSQQQLPGSCTDLQNRVPVGGILLRG
jgi:hypothetical protein